MDKKQKSTSGDIVRVKIDETCHTYARVLNHSDLAFYDLVSEQEVEALNSIVSRPVLFRAIVNYRGVEGGLWPIIGNLPLEDSLQNSIYYLTDVTDPNYFRICENGEIRDATVEECKGLEVHAIWDPVHIEQRLKDHYAGKPNAAIMFLDKLGNYKLKC